MEHSGNTIDNLAAMVDARLGMNVTDLPPLVDYELGRREVRLWRRQHRWLVRFYWLAVLTLCGGVWRLVWAWLR